MVNSADPDQTAPSDAVWPRSALFAYIILWVIWCLKFQNINHTICIRLDRPANRVDPVQTLQNATSDQGLHCLPLVDKKYKVKSNGVNN